MALNQYHQLETFSFYFVHLLFTLVHLKVITFFNFHLSTYSWILPHFIEYNFDTLSMLSLNYSFSLLLPPLLMCHLITVLMGKKGSVQNSYKILQLNCFPFFMFNYSS